MWARAAAVVLRRRPCGVEVEDAHVAQLRAALRGADVDRVAALARGRLLVVADPGAGALELDAPEGAAQLARPALGHRRGVVADDEGDRAEDEGQAGEQPQGPARAEAAGAQDRVLRGLGEARQRVDRADQDGQRHELVEVGRREQERIGGGVQRRVAATADIAQLVDEVDEEEQREEGYRDEGDRRGDVDVEQAPDRPHVAAWASRGRLARRRRGERARPLPCSRHQSSDSAIRNAPPWMTSSAGTSASLPLATHAWVRLIRL